MTTKRQIDMMSRYSAEDGDDSGYFAAQHAEEARTGWDRVKKLETALRLIQLHAGCILEAESRPGYELREFAEEVHAMAAAGLSSGEPIKNEASR